MPRSLSLGALAVLSVLLVACGAAVRDTATLSMRPVSFTIYSAPKIGSGATAPAGPPALAPAGWIGGLPAIPGAHLLGGGAGLPRSAAAGAAPAGPSTTIVAPSTSSAAQPTPLHTPTPALPPAEVAEASVGSGAAYAGQCGYFPPSVAQWWPVVTRYNWDPCTALLVIQRESNGLSVYNYGGSGACGVMQLLPCEYPGDGAANIARGYQKYAARGWQPWASTVPGY